MKHTLLSLALAGLAVLAGCAQVEPAPEEGAASAATADGQQAVARSEPLTGSRLPNRQSSERMLKMTGNADYRQNNEHKSLGNLVGNKTN